MSVEKLADEIVRDCIHGSLKNRLDTFVGKTMSDEVYADIVSVIQEEYGTDTDVRIVE